MEKISWEEPKLMVLDADKAEGAVYPGIWEHTTYTNPNTGKTANGSMTS